MRAVPATTNSHAVAREAVAPSATGLYDPRDERDACGLASVVSLNSEPSHRIVRLALEALENLEHRGAVGSDAGTGDGAGILCEIPDAFFRAAFAEHDSTLIVPEPGHYATGLVFFPREAAERRAQRYRFASIAAEEGLRILGWRSVDVRPDVLGDAARAASPVIEQPLLAPTGVADTDEIERRAFRTRKRLERETGVYLPSLSARTVVYKGMVTTLQLSSFYPELADERFAARFAIVHSRYSTNTFPSWHLAQPFLKDTATTEIYTRSTPSAATATGCGRASPSSPVRCSETSVRSCRSARRAAATRRASTRCSNCS